MSGTEHPPPPGASPPSASPPGYPPPGYPPPGQPAYPLPTHAAPTSYPPPATAGPGWGAPAGAPLPPGMLGAAHKPGVMPLRPLTLGDMYDAAFKIIRFNPRATVGSAVLVAAVAMAIPVVVTAILSFALDLTLDPKTDPAFGTQAPTVGTDPSTAELIGLVGPSAALLLGGLLTSLGLIFVTGMIAHVTAAAAIGRRLSLGRAWRATHGKRWRLIGLAVVLGVLTLLALGALVAAGVIAILVFEAAGAPGAVLVLAGIGGTVVGLALMTWFWVRFYLLAVPPLMLEPVGVWGAIGRAWRLTSAHFWRTFGIALLTVVITSIAGQILAVPLGLVGGLLAGSMSGSQFAMLVLVATQSLGAVLSTAFTAPFTAAVTTLQYLDLRMRKEAYDVELLALAGVTPVPVAPYGTPSGPPYGAPWA
jgi:hypothetical protein